MNISLRRKMKIIWYGYIERNSLIVCFNSVGRKSLESGRGEKWVGELLRRVQQAAQSCTKEWHSWHHELRYGEMTRYGTFIEANFDMLISTSCSGGFWLDYSLYCHNVNIIIYLTFSWVDSRIDLLYIVLWILLLRNWTRVSCKRLQY